MTSNTGPLRHAGLVRREAREEHQSNSGPVRSCGDGLARPRAKLRGLAAAKQQSALAAPLDTPPPPPRLSPPRDPSNGNASAADQKSEPRPQATEPPGQSSSLAPSQSAPSSADLMKLLKDLKANLTPEDHKELMAQLKEIKADTSKNVSVEGGGGALWNERPKP